MQLKQVANIYQNVHYNSDGTREIIGPKKSLNMFSCCYEKWHDITIPKGVKKLGFFFSNV